MVGFGGRSGILELVRQAVNSTSTDYESSRVACSYSPTRRMPSPDVQDIRTDGQSHTIRNHN
jgi:hypothetical protein